MAPPGPLTRAASLQGEAEKRRLLKTAAASAINRPLVARLKQGCRGDDIRSIPSTLA